MGTIAQLAIAAIYLIVVWMTFCRKEKEPNDKNSEVSTDQSELLSAP